MDDAQVRAAFKAKEHGNAHFRAGRHIEAAREFSAAIASLTPSSELSDEATTLLATCLLNRAAAQLQLFDLADAGSAVAHAQGACDDCSSALTMLGSPLVALRRKALFRRALAHANLGASDDAVADLCAVIGEQARAGERPSDEAMTSLSRLLAAPILPGDAALASAVEVLLAVLARGLDEGGTEGAGGAAVPTIGGTVGVPPALTDAQRAAIGANLVSSEHKWQAYTSLLGIFTEREGGRSLPMRTFLACGGPRLAHLHLHSMEGDWMVDAKRGTLRIIDKLLRLPTVQAAVAALELNPHGLHVPPANGAATHGAGCTH